MSKKEKSIFDKFKIYDQNKVAAPRSYGEIPYSLS